jgi:Na+-driven multidrug efflux pump
LEEKECGHCLKCFSHPSHLIGIVFKTRIKRKHGHTIHTIGNSKKIAVKVPIGESENNKMHIHLPKRPENTENPEARFQKMTREPVNRLTVSLAGPTMVSMTVTALYNTADTYFVSQLGTSASGAVGVVLSLMAMIQAVGFTLGVGSGNCVSRMLGQKNQNRAEQAAAAGFFSALLCGGLLLLFGTLFINSLVRVLGATDTIMPYAMDYARYILFGAPYMAGAFVLNNILRAQGSAFYAMVGIGTGGILNILLDPLFIFVFNWGIAGAAIATITSQAVSFGIQLYFSLGERTSR